MVFLEEVIQLWTHGVDHAYILTGRRKTKYKGKMNML